MKKLPRLIIFFILYIFSVILITYKSFPAITSNNTGTEGESKNIIEILRLSIKALAGGNNESANQLRNYLILIFISSYLLFVLIQVYVKRIKWKYLVLCPLGLMLLGLMIFELIRILPGIGSTAENNQTFYYILSIAMIISAFISIRYMYHEVFTGKQKPKKIAIPRRHA